MNLFEYLRRWFHREPGLLQMPQQPEELPPLPRQQPAHERPSILLTLSEKAKFDLLAELAQDLEALDPREQL